MKVLYIIAMLTASPAYAQQFNPDAAAYEINKTSISLASYARALEQQFVELRKEVADLKSKSESPKKEPPEKKE